VHVVGFIIRICHEARSPERQMLHISVEVFTVQHSTTQKVGTLLVAQLVEALRYKPQVRGFDC